MLRGVKEAIMTFDGQLQAHDGCLETRFARLENGEQHPRSPVRLPLVPGYLIHVNALDIPIQPMS